MLADGVEASVRSLASRDEPAIRAMVARIIDERMADGQFDECDLTLRDIERIKEAFVGQLLGMYHQRDRLPPEQGRRDRVAPRDGDRHRRVSAADGLRRSPGGSTSTVRDGVDLTRRRAGSRRLCRARRRGARRRRRADAGVDRADPLRRRASWPSSNATHLGARRPDRRPVVPAPAAGGVPAARGGPEPPGRDPRPPRSSRRPAGGRTSATSSSRSSARPSRRPPAAAARPATSAGRAADELRLLVTHGALHVCGWDHADPAEEAAMRALEQRLLAEG